MLATSSQTPSSLYVFFSGLHENAGPEIRVAATAVDLLIERQVKMDIQQ